MVRAFSGAACRPVFSRNAPSTQRPDVVNFLRSTTNKSLENIARIGAPCDMKHRRKMAGFPAIGPQQMCPRPEQRSSRRRLEFGPRKGYFTRTCPVEVAPICGHARHVRSSTVDERRRLDGKGVTVTESVSEFMDRVSARSPGEPEFHQAVHEVVESIWPVLERHPEFRDAKILDRMVEPERVIMFRVPWVDDRGEVHVNRGFRIEMNSAIGPYKGGLRFHPTVNLGTLKFLAFEQVFKNGLTTLPLGGGKGGADFDPKGRSDGEVMRFCQAFMSELFRHIGANTDVPAGDIGVGAREIGFLFGQYKKLANEFTGILTGKRVAWGGSLIRPESTGYGTVYFAEEMLKTRGEGVYGKTCLVSGSGNVAQFAVENLNRLGGRVVTMSDSEGFVYDRDGFDTEKLGWVKELKNVRRGRIREYAEEFGAEFFAGKRPWAVEGAQVALPCATQNELDGDDARRLLDNGVYVVAEGANMPSQPDAVAQFVDREILFAPGKASNAGGVATSGLEMAQNAGFTAWDRETVDERLLGIMVNIHQSCRASAEEYGKPGNYVSGANIVGFMKVASAMVDQGVV